MADQATEEVREPGVRGFTDPVTSVVPDDLERPPAPSEPLYTTVHRRTPADLTRLLWFVGFLAVGAVLATGLDETMAGIEADLLEGFVRIPASAAGLIVSTV